MFARSILHELRQWLHRVDRKPLLLRGARQVGKTTAARMFASEFLQSIEVNLDRPDHHAFFSDFQTIDQWLKALFVLHGISWESRKDVLVFIDEIQAAPAAIHGLRYLRELLPEIPVIAAGSALEFALKEVSAAPVGRVDIMVLRPFSFQEFLEAHDQKNLADAMFNSEIVSALHRPLSETFQLFLNVGGMPELVAASVRGDEERLGEVAAGLLASYHDDLARFARPNTGSALREILMQAFRRAGDRIQFEGFVDRHAKRETVRNGLNLLRDGQVLDLVYPTSDVELPLTKNLNRRPRLHPLDCGLVSQMMGAPMPPRNPNFRGKLAELAVGQELLASSFSPLHQLHFWTREKARAQAEVDYLWPVAGHVIPIEVKSGAAGKLRSLHQFMAASRAPFAIRVSDAPLSSEWVQFAGQSAYRLFNVPHYLAGQIPELAKHWLEGPELMWS